MAMRRANKVLNNEKIISFLEDSDDSMEDVTWKPSPKKINKYSNTSKIKNRKRGHEVDFIVQTSSKLLPIASSSSPDVSVTPVVPITEVSAASTEVVEDVCSLVLSLPSKTMINDQTQATSPRVVLIPPKTPSILQSPQNKFATSPVIGVLVRSPTRRCQSPDLPNSPSILQEQFDEDYLVQAMSPLDVLIPPATAPIVQMQSTSQPVGIIQSAISPTGQGPTGSPPVVPGSPPIPQALSDEDSLTQTSKQSRKRQRNISTWKKNIRKQRRNEGKEYVSTKGKTVPAKVLKSFDHVCRYQCNNFTESERKIIHSEYWNLGSWEAQTNFIRYCVQIQKPKRSISKKKISTVIILNTKRVCKDFFLKTLTISNRRFTNAAFTKTPITGLPVHDKRGKHEPGNKTNEDKLRDMRAHINSFPKFKSHYSREDAPLKRYLSPELSVSKMYCLYKQKAIAEDKQPVKEQIYRKVFNNEFNLGFYKLRSDTCNTCDRLENLYKCEENAEKRQNIKEEKSKHLLDVEITRESKHRDKEDKTVHLITFDLEKTLPTPYLQTNLVYYKRQLWTYNLGIHDCRTGDAHMYMWSENIASRGASEIASCLLKYVGNDVPKECNHLVAYSDSCGGQNRNQIICRLWMYIVAHTHIATVDHKFMVPGHSYLENDADFSHIEKQKKKAQHIYVPEDWMNLVDKTRKKFKVHRMQQDDFISTDPISKVIINRKIDSAKNKINWLKIRWTRFLKDKPKNMFFKESLDDSPFRCVQMDAKKGIIPKILPKLRDTEIKIKSEKYKDLMELLKFIPPVHHSFYNALKSEENYNQQSSFTSRPRGRPRKNSMNETDEESVLDYTLDE